MFPSISDVQQKLSYCQYQLLTLSESVIHSLFKLQQLQDAYTAGHSYRVALLCKAIAEEMGWDKQRCQQVYYAGLLHDLGKMVIAPALLHKTTRLEPEELEHIKMQVRHTFETLKDIPFHFPLAEIIVQHHERIDGSGYPAGLMGSQMYDEAKVLVVADVVEAMTNRRSYRDELGLDMALLEIRQGQGRIYDAEVCDALLRLVEQKLYQIPVDRLQERISTLL